MRTALSNLNVQWNVEIKRCQMTIFARCQVELRWMMGFLAGRVRQGSQSYKAVFSGGREVRPVVEREGALALTVAREDDGSVR